MEFGKERGTKLYSMTIEGVRGNPKYTERRNKFISTEGDFEYFHNLLKFLNEDECTFSDELSTEESSESGNESSGSGSSNKTTNKYVTSKQK